MLSNRRMWKVSGSTPKSQDNSNKPSETPWKVADRVAAPSSGQRRNWIQSLELLPGTNTVVVSQCLSYSTSPTIIRRDGCYQHSCGSGSQEQHLMMVGQLFTQKPPRCPTGNVLKTRKCGFEAVPLCLVYCKHNEQTLVWVYPCARSPWASWCCTFGHFFHDRWCEILHTALRGPTGTNEEIPLSPVHLLDMTPKNRKHGSICSQHMSDCLCWEWAAKAPHSERVWGRREPSQSLFTHKRDSLLLPPPPLKLLFIDEITFK